jgi:hypothetical protein
MEAKEWFLEENKVPASGAMAKYGRWALYDGGWSWKGPTDFYNNSYQLTVGDGTMTMVERGALAQRKREGTHLVHVGQPGRRAKEMK